MACSDREFVAYIKRKLDAFEEGTPIQVDGLMKNAADKYKTLLQRGSWNAPDANEEKILALQTEIRKLKKKATKTQNGTPSKKAKSIKEEPRWFNERPKTTDLHKSREWNGKTWWYCHPETGGKCDGKYRLHKPSQCQGSNFRFTKTSENEKRKNKGESSNSNNQRNLRLNQALRAASAVAERDEAASDSTEAE